MWVHTFKGEYSISQILNNKNIPFKKEYNFLDCCDVNPLRFDFALFDKNTNTNLVGLIEY